MLEYGADGMAAGPACEEGVSSFLCEKTKAQRGQEASPQSHSEGEKEPAPKPGLQPQDPCSPHAVPMLGGNGWTEDPVLFFTCHGC